MFLVNIMGNKNEQKNLDKIAKSSPI